MPRGIGMEYFTVLDKILEVNLAKGVYIRDLKLITEFHIQRNNLQIPIAASMFTPLTEMYLMAKDMNHEFKKNREGVFVSGVTFRKNEIRELIETLTLGISRSSKSAAEAERLYAASFSVTTIPSE